MNRTNLWRFILVALVLVWSAYELYPPTPRDLIQVFRDRAIARDATLAGIVQKAQELQRGMPEKPYDNLKQAIGTNDITKYFPMWDAKEQKYPTAFILNKLQREAAGRVRLGLDLQGGTSFTVRMDTSSLTNTP